jgi:predicted ATPase
VNANNSIRFLIKNIGQIESAEISLNQMTVISGKNSVSKTYITYLIFGFLDYIKNLSENNEWKTQIIEKLITSDSKVRISLSSFASGLPLLIEQSANNYCKIAYKVLSFEPDSDFLSNFYFNVIVDNLYINYENNLDITSFFIAKNVRIELNKISNTDEVEIYIIVEDDAILDDHIYELVASYIVKTIINFFIKQIFPIPFIVTSERTGVSLFYKELDTSRNSLIELLQQEIGYHNDINNLLMKKHVSRYPLPIKLNMDFIRNIFDISKNKTNLKSTIKTFIAKNISNGKYTFDKNLNQIFFVPKTEHKLKLPIHSTSSSVKSLLLFDAFINFIADTNQILIIDEPELNLHPDNQRKMARLLAMLTNHGVKVLFTTHSDYIVKELNNLIMLYGLGTGNQTSVINHFNKIYHSGYNEDMPIKATDINCYTIVENKQGFFSYQSDIDCYGINLAILDDEINNLSEISQILYNELDNGEYR